MQITIPKIISLAFKKKVTQNQGERRKHGVYHLCSINGTKKWLSWANIIHQANTSQLRNS